MTPAANDKVPAYLTAPVSYPRSVHRPAEVLHALAGQLRQRGIINLYGASCARYGVLSLPDVSVWTNGRLLWWRGGVGETGWPAADPEGAARQLAGLGQAGEPSQPPAAGQ